MTSDDTTVADSQRACGSGGTWQPCHEYDAAGERRTVETMATNKDDARLLLRELKRKMELAQQGELTYGKDRDVYRSWTASGVFELRMSRRIQYPNNEERAVRLYFAEPEVLPNVMLAARLAAKPATKEGLDLQDDQMLEAKLRIDQHPGL